MRYAAMLLGLSLLTTSPSTPTEPRELIDRVEEDWELIIAQPDVPAAGPQITTTMTPSSVSASTVVNFNLNYREKPLFQAGGLQVQAWNGSDIAALATHGDALLNSESETITWTQRLSLSASQIEYEVRSGQSTTWGNFGGDDLKVSFASNLSDLGGYSSENSLAKSGVGWQSDHVTSMKLVQVRYYSLGTLVLIEDTARSVPSLQSP